MDAATLKLALALSLLGLAFGVKTPVEDGYVPYGEFAERFGLRHRYEAASFCDHFEGPGLRLTIAVGSRQVFLNGDVRSFLEPAILRDGSLFISEDVAAWVGESATGPAAPIVERPLPDLPARSSALSGLRIVVDPGHGGVHDGWKGLQGLVEKDVNLDVSRRLAERLRAQGADVILTRSGDAQFSDAQREDLRRRTLFANQQAADAFISLHCNGADTAAARGFEVWIEESASDAARKRSSARLAESVRRAMRGATSSPDRGVREKNFYVIHNTTCPAVLVEMDFISNAESATLMRSADHRDRIADALAKAVAEWRGR